MSSLTDGYCCYSIIIRMLLVSFFSGMVTLAYTNNNNNNNTNHNNNHTHANTTTNSNHHTNKLLLRDGDLMIHLH